jgi:hypothetical protein
MDSQSYLKNASNAQWLRCEPSQNTHILPYMLRFFVGSRLTIKRNLLFLRQLFVHQWQKVFVKSEAFQFTVTV